MSSFASTLLSLAAGLLGGRTKRAPGGDGAPPANKRARMEQASAAPGEAEAEAVAADDAPAPHRDVSLEEYRQRLQQQGARPVRSTYGASGGRFAAPHLQRRRAGAPLPPPPPPHELGISGLFGLHRLPSGRPRALRGGSSGASGGGTAPPAVGGGLHLFTPAAPRTSVVQLALPPLPATAATASDAQHLTPTPPPPPAAARCAAAVSSSVARLRSSAREHLEHRRRLSGGDGSTERSAGLGLGERSPPPLLAGATSGDGDALPSAPATATADDGDAGGAPTAEGGRESGPEPSAPPPAAVLLPVHVDPSAPLGERAVQTMRLLEALAAPKERQQASFRAFLVGLNAALPLPPPRPPPAAAGSAATAVASTQTSSEYEALGVAAPAAGTFEALAAAAVPPSSPPTHHSAQLPPRGGAAALRGDGSLMDDKEEEDEEDDGGGDATEGEGGDGGAFDEDGERDDTLQPLRQQQAPARGGDSGSVIDLLSSSDDEEEQEEQEQANEGVAAGAAASSGVAPAAAQQHEDTQADDDVIDLCLSSDDEEEEGGQAAASGPPLSQAAGGGETEDEGGEEEGASRLQGVPEHARCADPRLSRRDLLRFADLVFARDRKGNPAPPPGWDGKLEVGEAGRDFVTSARIQCLFDGVWLNDEVINFALTDALFRNRDALAAGGQRPSAAAAAAPAPLLGPGGLTRDGRVPTLCFSTHFLPELRPPPSDGGHHDAVYQFDGAARWTVGLVKRWGLPRAVDCDVILVPLHLGIHWALAGLDVRARALHYWDSMAASDGSDGMGVQPILRDLLRWLSDESAAKLGEAARWDTGGWRVVRHPGSAVPRQLNGNDCGLFMLSFARRIMDGAAGFDGCYQRDMPFLRRRLALDIDAAGRRNREAAAAAAAAARAARR